MPEISFIIPYSRNNKARNLRIFSRLIQYLSFSKSKSVDSYIQHFLIYTNELTFDIQLDEI